MLTRKRDNLCIAVFPLLCWEKEKIIITGSALARNFFYKAFYNAGQGPCDQKQKRGVLFEIAAAFFTVVRLVQRRKHAGTKTIRRSVAVRAFEVFETISTAPDLPSL